VLGHLTSGARLLPGGKHGYTSCVVAFLVLLLVIWAILAVIGLALKGLLWLFFIGLILFFVTGVVGWVNRRTGASRR
jgi:hypothetical protein